MNDTINAHMFPEVFKALGIDLGRLGCIMMDTEPLLVSDLIPDEVLYTSDTKQYVDGVVSETVPHVTLLYGLMRSGPELQLHVDELLDGWSLEPVTIRSVEFFDSPDPEEPYYCIVAKLEVTDQLLEGHGRIAMLPHIDDFMTYEPHITLAYIKQDEKVRDDVLYALNERFAGKEVQAKGLNYGD